MSLGQFVPAERSQDLAAELADLLLLKLKKYNEMRNLMLQERRAIEMNNADALWQLLELRQKLMGQMSGLETDYQRLKEDVARQVYLDDVDFFTLLHCMPPEQVGYLRRMNNDIILVARELASLSETIQEMLARRQLAGGADGGAGEREWLRHPVYQYGVTVRSGEPRWVERKERGRK